MSCITVSPQSPSVSQSESHLKGKHHEIRTEHRRHPSCHFHGSKPAAEATVLGCAQQRKEALVKAGKIDAPWQAIKHDKVEAVDGKKGKEWKVTFKDPAAKDKAKETLYIFFTAPGNFIAANFTGQ